MLQPQEFFGESLIDMTSRVPEPEQADDLRAEHFAEVHAYLQRQAELWCDMARQDVARLPGAWRWASACSHTCSSATSLSCSTVACPPWTNLSQTSDGLSGADKLDRGYWYGLLVSMLALISTALVKSADGGAPRPFLQVRLQLWMRELRRLVCKRGHGAGDALCR